MARRATAVLGAVAKIDRDLSEARWRDVGLVADGSELGERRVHASMGTRSSSRFLISTLRGLARSAIGIRKVRTPAS